MLQGILAILLFIVIIIAIVAMVVIRFVYRGISRLRDAARSAVGLDDEPDNGNDYTGRRNRQYSQREGRRTTSQQRQQSRRTRTSGRTGGTIIDTRDPETAGRKIFTADEGEYVDYEEV